jgi:hypothetical protein
MSPFPPTRRLPSTVRESVQWVSGFDPQSTESFPSFGHHRDFRMPHGRAASSSFQNDPPEGAA